MVNLLVKYRLLEEFIREHWPNGAADDGRARLLRYETLLRRHSASDSILTRASQALVAHNLCETRILTIEPPQAGQRSSEIVAFVRGLAIFNTRRVSKFTQEELLGRYLPSAIRFIGAFDKSGNYALTTRVSQDEAAQAIVDALTHDERLADLTRSHVSVVLVSELVLALEGLIQSVTALHGDRFDPRSFEVRIATARWRAGITFLPEPPAVRPFLAGARRTKGRGPRKLGAHC